MRETLKTIIVERDAGVVTVTMNRPERKNAATGTMRHELLTTFEDAAADRDDRVLVLTGAGDAFCSGADLSDPGDVAGRPESARASPRSSPRAASRSTSAPPGCCPGSSACTGPRSWPSSPTSSTREAAELGLINRVVPDDQLVAFVDGWAGRLAEGPTLALSLTESMLNASFGLSMEQAVEDEARSQSLNFTTQDTQEALRAFAEKRPPRFEGR